MIIGNILTTDEISFKEFKTINNLNEKDNNLPTLIVGWELTKDIVDGDKVSILRKK